mgnify:CR=1 FL=1
MSNHKDKFSAERMCRVLQVSKSTYYRRASTSVGVLEERDRTVGNRIKGVYEASRKSYGSPRIAKELKTVGLSISRQRTARIMKTVGISAVQKPAFRNTTDSNHNYAVVPNVLARNFNTQRSGQVWVSDTAYLATSEGWLHLTVILDLFRRRVVGWSMSTGMSVDQTTLPAFLQAIRKYPPTQELLFHSDRGVQYAAYDFKKVLAANPLITRSMSRKGNCWDNAVAESFFSTLKRECMTKNKLATRKEAEIIVFEWIATWYNRFRRHSHLNQMNIFEFEQQFFKPKKAA